MSVCMSVCVCSVCVQCVCVQCVCVQCVCVQCVCAVCACSVCACSVCVCSVCSVCVCVQCGLLCSVVCCAVCVQCVCVQCVCVCSVCVRSVCGAVCACVCVQCVCVCVCVQCVCVCVQCVAAVCVCSCRAQCVHAACMCCVRAVCVYMWFSLYCIIPLQCGYSGFPLLSPVIEDIMPDNVTATLGTNVMFNCSASGSEDISYRWTRTMVGTDGSLVDVGFYDESSGRFNGVDTAMLTILNVGVLDVEGGQDYTCFVNVSDITVGFRTAILQTRSELMPAHSYSI